MNKLYSKKIKKPKISVILPIYNGERFIEESLESILSQSFRDLELIIIDDASTDTTPVRIKKFKDKRIVILRNKKNLGVTKTLNKGLKRARGEYIARCDADDVNDKSRFKLQVNFLDSNPEYILVGSNAEIINEKGKKVGQTDLPKSNFQIRRQMIIRNPILHPSVMIRRKTLILYREFFNGAEDYDLWFRIMNKGKFYNLDQKLIKRRWHDEVITRKNHLGVEAMALLVRFINIPKWLLVQISS